MKSVGTATVLFVVFLCLCACDPRKFPGAREAAKRQEERITRETEDAIRKSPALHNLNRLCTEEIPLPEGFIAVSKSRDFNNERFLSFGYRSTRDWESVKRFYTDFFIKTGWHKTKQTDDGWGPAEIEFRKYPYGVTVYYMADGSETNVDIVCRTL